MLCDATNASCRLSTSDDLWLVTSLNKVNFTNTSLRTDEQLTESMSVLYTITQFYVPLIIFVGLLGNITSVLVFFTSKLKQVSSSYYLAALATADSGFLFALFIVWLNSLDVDWYSRNGGCKFVIYCTLVCSFLSVWLVVAFTVERFIAVCYPLHRPTMCTVRRAKMTIAGLVLFAMMAYSYAFLVAGIVYDAADGYRTPQCLGYERYLRAMTVLNNVDTVTTLIVPFIIIVVMNVTIARKIIAFYKRRSQMNEDLTPAFSARVNRKRNLKGESSVNSSPPTQGSLLSTASFRATNQRSGNGTTQSSFRETMRSRTQIRITKMLLIVSTVFIILNLPSHAVRLHVVFEALLNPLFEATDRLQLTQQYTQLIYYTNFSINFFLYSLAGANFRKALSQLFRRLCACVDLTADEVQTPITIVQFPLRLRTRDNSVNSQTV